MDKEALLLEYLKEQYVQARQHETLRSNTTTYLTTATGVLVGLAFKDGTPHHAAWPLGFVVFLIGIANIFINRAHYIGNRFHAFLAGKTREELEKALGWPPIQVTKSAQSPVAPATAQSAAAPTVLRVDVIRIPEPAVLSPSWIRNNAVTVDAETLQKQIGTLGVCATFKDAFSRQDLVVNDDFSVGAAVHRALQRIPSGIMLVGLLVTTACLFSGCWSSASSGSAPQVTGSPAPVSSAVSVSPAASTGH